jgi:hypothetical protein
MFTLVREDEPLRSVVLLEPLRSAPDRSVAEPDFRSVSVADPDFSPEAAPDLVRSSVVVEPDFVFSSEPDFIFSSVVLDLSSIVLDLSSVRDPELFSSMPEPDFERSWAAEPGLAASFADPAPEAAPSPRLEEPRSDAPEEVESPAPAPAAPRSMPAPPAEDPELEPRSEAPPDDAPPAPMLEPPLEDPEPPAPAPALSDPDFDEPEGSAPPLCADTPAGETASARAATVLRRSFFMILPFAIAHPAIVKRALGG